MKIKGVIEDLKIKLKNGSKNSKNISRTFSGVVGSVGQFIFRQFLGPSYISQDLQAPSYVVGTNYRVLIYCTCHFQGGSLCFSFCLLVSSVFNFCPDIRGAVVDTFLGSLVQSCCGEGGTLQTNNTSVCLQCLGHTGFAPAHSVCAFPVYAAQALG